MPPAISFLRQALQNPRTVASIAPSGPSLARGMAQALPPGTVSVVELGPGTGPVTKALLDHGISPRCMMAVEHNRAMGMALRQSFPQLPTAIADARFLPFILRDSHWPSRVDAVVSSLGLRAMPLAMLREIVSNADTCLRQGGVFIQYSYRSGSPIPAELCQTLGWDVEIVQKVWRNLPPATIYRYTKR